MLLRLIRQNYSFFLPYVILLIVVGSMLSQLDRTVLMRWINGYNHPFWDRFFYYLTDLADGATGFGVAVGLLFVRFRWALAAGLSFLLAGEFTQLLKHVFYEGELRPSAFYKNSGWAFHTVEGLNLHSVNSFPSGHSTSVFALCCLLTLLVTNKNWGWLFLAIAVLGAYSRVYLFQHFVVDIYVGSIIGTVTTLVVFAGLESYWKNHPKTWLDRRVRLRRSL
ncbi:phosphatase PAP2 family protein [Siphonobacter sp. SORGH_AS_0500]|uniref:phosphatase PAP2 family protein n=1 Tax=Siphonobacter sp. SORGH_AS_0500 TaxID=1864824 RepID=UPI0028580A23|nr:phosphatase PAP2 family protein [Siphonobacter sp. SORGH_AS_0500]MDR6193399.1 membrane-associated phospholipid phosphatase [Siphonobacter sp. SORGH_AS_0500]